VPITNSEFLIIENFFKPLTNGSAAAQNLSDDAAKISLKPSEELVVSKDIAIEGVHFLSKDGGFKIASKVLRANLSDLAACGAKPLYYMLGFSKNKNIDQNFVKEFVRGLKETQEEYGISLIGGDTIKSPDRLFFSITIFGVVKKNQALLRSKAKKNDVVFVSGNIGDALIGMLLSHNSEKYDKSFSKKEKDYFLSRHFFPIPRIKLGLALTKNKIANAAIDVSDGLLADLLHICKESKLSANIYLEKIPITKKKLPEKISLLDLISAGDDYELIFTAKKSCEKQILQLAKKLKIKITAIGYLTNNKTTPDISLFDSDNKKVNISKYGYEH